MTWQPVWRIGERLKDTPIFGWLDFPILLSMLAATVGAFWFQPQESGARATAYVDGKPLAWWSLQGPNSTDTIDARLGAVVVQHGNGAIRILQAPCPNRLCIKQGSVHRTHDELVCVPSHLVVAIEGKATKGGLDAVH